MERMSGQVGPSYLFAMFLGMGYGALQTPPAKSRRTTRLMINTYINNIGRNGSKFANNTAAAVLLYCIVGRGINFIFLEELEDFGMNQTAQNILYGGMTGAIYKCTRGFRPMILSACIGALLSQAYHIAWQKGYFDLSKKSNEAGMHYGSVQGHR